MTQEDTQQKQTMMRTAMDNCCSRWAPILPQESVLPSGAGGEKSDSGHVAIKDAGSELTKLPKE